MRLLIDGEIYSWHLGGGISRIFNELVPKLSRLGVDVIVGVKRHTDEKRIGLDVLPRVQWIPQVSPRLRPWRIWRRISLILNPLLVYLYWRQKRADVFMSTYYTNPPVKAHKICVVHDMIFELFPECFEADFCKATIRRQHDAIDSADLVICVSENTRQDLIRLWGIKENRCRTIHNGGLTVFESNAKKPAVHGKPYLLYVGDYRCAYKNFKFVLSCLGSLTESSIAKYELVIVSRVVPDNAELNVFSSYFAINRMRFINDCTDEVLMSYYRGCEAFIYPSLYEGFGLPVQEALSQGTPVVCSNSSSLPEVGGDAVYYFDPKSPEQFKFALEIAIAAGRRPDLVTKRQAQAFAFSWDKTASEYLDAFRDVIK